MPIPSDRACEIRFWNLCGGAVIKNLPNFITSLRIPLAVIMVLSEPFSAFFWSCYCLGGISDLLDGFAARKLNLHSDAGARMDSIADAVFAAAIAVVAIRSIPLPGWLWLCVCGIAFLRIVGYIIGFCKYRTFSSLHTYANKATGVLIFAFPVLFAALGLTATGVLLCAAAFISSLEELVITAKSQKLNRDCKGLLVQERE
ncbi:MAG: CDP-alcohol phosphatidyltransferase family protein [Lawsonibacter sp.]|nr:CDP-alcohol phosphatidyltransferase family protein [Lawsonibacter sp.]